MIVGFIFVAILVGSIAFAVALFFLASVWLAFGAYALVGATVLTLLAIALMARGAGREAFEEDADHKAALPTPRLSPAHTSAITNASMRILAVDDDPFILELIPMLAAKAGFPDVTAVASGEHALWILANSDMRFDCLLFDISMPGMDGIELCRGVRQMAPYAKTPILMLTAMRDLKNMGNAYRAGATDYVTKPFDIEELGTRLHLAQVATLAGHETAPERRYNQENVTVAVSKKRLDLFKGIEGLVAQTALESYLTQFPRKDVSCVQVYGVAIVGLDEFQTSTSSPETAALLGEVSLAVADCFGVDQLLMAYTDTATLLVVTNSVHPLAGINIEARIETWLSNKGYGLSVAVGGSIPLQGSKAERARLTIERALICAELRGYEKEVAPIARVQFR